MARIKIIVFYFPDYMLAFIIKGTQHELLHIRYHLVTFF